MNLKEVTYSPLSSSDSFKAVTNGNQVTVTNNHSQSLKTSFERHESLLKIHILDSSSTDFSELFLITCEYLLGHLSDIKNIEVINGHNLLLPFANFQAQAFTREEFFQIPSLWHHKSSHTLLPEKWIESNGTTHPQRLRPHQGVVYKRYVPQIEKTITFRLIDIEKDLDVFHEWHNQYRVYYFWELNKSKEELREYLEKGLKAPHQFPMMLEIDGVPAGYYEFYWVKEDRLGPYYDSEAWDRGFHFLIGNKNFLGFENTDAILKSGLHFMYLDDPRTRKIMAEPRSDNQKVLKYAVASRGWTKLKEFDFPHKRAALLENRRETFFAGNSL